jgi:hypothetical protein
MFILIMNARAQGTIEYLVIIGIVVVISLVVVGLLTQQMGSAENVSKTSSKISGLTQSIGITESLVSPTDQNFVVKLLNNSGSTLTISNVKIGDSNINFSEDLAQGGSKLFKVSTSNVCEEGKVVSENVVITYVTSEGLTKTEIYPVEVMFDCTPYNIAQANLANQCPSCSGGSGITPDGNATAAQVLSGYSFYGNGVTKLNGSLKKYANLGSGQTTCYDVDGNPRSCDGTGEDGELYGSAYRPTWVDNGDGTISDLNSGLMWMKTNHMYMEGFSGALNWQEALDFCTSLVLCSDNTFHLTNCVGHGDIVYGDWHLPTAIEALTMQDFNSDLSTTDGVCYSYFADCSAPYWTSTTARGYDFAAFVFLPTGSSKLEASMKNSGVYTSPYGFSNGIYSNCVRFQD